MWGNGNTIPVQEVAKWASFTFSPGLSSQQLERFQDFKTQIHHPGLANQYLCQHWTSHKPPTPKNKTERKQPLQLNPSGAKRTLGESQKKKRCLKIANLIVCVGRLQGSVYFLLNPQNSRNQREGKSEGRKEWKQGITADTSQLPDSLIPDSTEFWLIPGVVFWFFFAAQFYLRDELHPPLPVPGAPLAGQTDISFSITLGFVLLSPPKIQKGTRKKSQSKSSVQLSPLSK